MQQEQNFFEKCRLGIVRLYRNTVTWIFFAILLFLCFISAISTTVLIQDNAGGHIFISDHPIISLLVIAFIIKLGLSLKDNRSVKKFITRVKQDEVYFRRLRIKMLAVLGIISAFWVLATQFIPTSDQLQIMDGVYDLHVEDYAKFQPGEYFEKYQNQYGLLLLSYFFSIFFGSSNYIVFSFFNIAALLFFYYELSELCGDFEFGRTAQLGVIAIGFAFYPLVIYCSYIYGTLCGLALGVAAMDMEMKFFAGKKRRHAIACAIFIMLSMTIKSNYLIFLIAAAICAVIEIIRQKKLKLIVLPLLIAVAAVVSSSVPKAITSHITGESFEGGASSWGWIAMGLQEGDRAPGAYNGYNIYLYDDICNLDSELHAKLAKEEIAERLKVFSQDKIYAASFFTKKQAYQWGDPTFQSAWNIRGKKSQVEISDWIQKFKSPQGANISIILLNPLMSAIYFGALLFCVLCRNNTNIYTLVLPMTFVGGFVFHTFWEAAPRYTLPYFVLLFPLAIAGYFKVVQLISQKQKKRPSLSELKSTSSGRKKIRSIVLSVLPYICILLAFWCAVGIYSIGISGYLTDGDVVYSEWLENNPK